MEGLNDVFADRLATAEQGLRAAQSSPELLAACAAAAQAVVDAQAGGGKVIFCGNGGSSMDAGHLAAEFLGHFYLDRPAMNATSLSDPVAALTAIGNDYGYDDVFARQLEGIAKPGDVLIGLTTSGNSRNVVAALEKCRDLGVVGVAMTGAAGGKVAEIADIVIAVPSTDTPRIQELCMHLGHTICEIVEAAAYGTANGDAGAA